MLYGMLYINKLWPSHQRPAFPGVFTTVRNHKRVIMVCLIIVIIFIGSSSRTLNRSNRPDARVILLGIIVLVLVHIKYSVIQLVKKDPFLAKKVYNCHRMDLVMIRPPGILKIVDIVIIVVVVIFCYFCKFGCQ